MNFTGAWSLPPLEAFQVWADYEAEGMGPYTVIHLKTVHGADMAVEYKSTAQIQNDADNIMRGLGVFLNLN